MLARYVVVLSVMGLGAACGSKDDLIIGEVRLAGAGAAPSAGVGAQPTGGTTPTGGSVAGSTEPGSGGLAGEPAAGASSMGGTGGTGEGCVLGSAPPMGSLLHRYSFDEAGDKAPDSVGGAEGSLIGTTLDGSGALHMDGKAKAYVDLPNGLISPLTEVTFVTWVTWKGGAAYQRILDFGISNNGEGFGTSGESYIAVMPTTGFDDQANPGLGAEIDAPMKDGTHIGTKVQIKNIFAQVAVVVRSGISVSLYMDGDLLGTKPTTILLSDIDDRNNWIGQSQYMDNPPFQGSYDEFRIYGAALDGCQLHTLLVRGPGNP